MAFNPNKCELIRITNKEKTILFNYILHGVGLKETDPVNMRPLHGTLGRKKYMNKIETIQHRAIGYKFNDYSFTSRVSNMFYHILILVLPLILEFLPKRISPVK